MERHREDHQLERARREHLRAFGESNRRQGSHQVRAKENRPTTLDRER